MTKTSTQNGVIPSLLSSALADLKARRVQREAHRKLVRELSTYTTAADQDDLNAMLARYDDGDVAEIRQILDRVQAA